MCTGNCKLGSSGQKLKLDFQPAGKIPDFFTKNSDGKIVFANPKPMTTISSPKGHNAWLKIDLVRIDGQFSNAEKYICLGIKKHSEDEYFDVLHMSNTSRYVDVMDGDPVDLVPLLSSTDVASKVTLVVPGEQMTPANFGISGDSFDFGSVYRINTEVQEGQWITETCKLYDAQRVSHGTVGVGPIDGKENQLLSVSADGSLVYSSNGINWNKLSVQFKPVDCAYIAYGNGIWCIVNSAGTWADKVGFDYSLRYSTDEGKSWTNSSIAEYYNVRCFAFGGGKFMTSDYKGSVYISEDGILWNKFTKKFLNWVRFLVYINGEWLAGNIDNGMYEYKSKDGVNWIPISSNLNDISSEGIWNGACFAHGCFYAICSKGIVVKSSTGGVWDEVTRFRDEVASIVYYKGKLYVFSIEGTVCHIGFPNP